VSGSLAAQIVIPIVVAIALFSWLAAVLWANAHPRYRSRSSPPRYEVAGGAFHAVDGGRQLMPIPEHRPLGVPSQRAGEPTAAGSMGAGSMGAGSMGAGSMGAGSMAAGSMAAGSTAAGWTAAGSTAAGWTAAGSTAAGSAAAGQVPRARAEGQPAGAASWPAESEGEPPGPAEQLATSAAGSRGLRLGASATTAGHPRLAGLYARNGKLPDFGGSLGPVADAQLGKRVLQVLSHS
jgi:hypothetical protein